MTDQSNSNFFGQGIIQRGNPIKNTPGSIRQTAFSSDFIKSTSVFISGANSVANGASLVVQSIVTSSTNPNLKLAGVPYQIVFLQTALDSADIIGGPISAAGYRINGPFCMPDFAPHAANSPSTVYGGSDGNNLVFLTELYNGTGSTKTIYYITNTRFVQSGGSAG